MSSLEKALSLGFGFPKTTTSSFRQNNRYGSAYSYDRQARGIYSECLVPIFVSRRREEGSEGRREGGRGEETMLSSSHAFLPFLASPSFWELIVVGVLIVYYLIY